ncbi:MAG: GNAT family N-acetyltransferase [Pseudomonadota bacterium]
MPTQHPLSQPPVPEVRTPRLLLRGHKLEDFDAFAAMQGDPAVMRYITGQPLSRDQAWQKFSRSPGHWHLRGFGYWIACDAETGQFLGELGFSDFERDLEPSLRGCLEAGWLLQRSAHGRGLATEAVSAAITWAGEHFPDRSIVCMISDDNAPSLRVAEKCGFAPWTTSRYHGEVVNLYRWASDT